MRSAFFKSALDRSSIFDRTQINSCVLCKVFYFNIIGVNKTQSSIIRDAKYIDLFNLDSIWIRRCCVFIQGITPSFCCRNVYPVTIGIFALQFHAACLQVYGDLMGIASIIRHTPIVRDGVCQSNRYIVDRISILIITQMCSCRINIYRISDFMRTIVGVPC